VGKGCARYVRGDVFSVKKRGVRNVALKSSNDFGKYADRN